MDFWLGFRFVDECLLRSHRQVSDSRVHLSSRSLLRHEYVRFYGV